MLRGKKRLGGVEEHLFRALAHVKVHLITLVIMMNFEIIMTSNELVIVHSRRVVCIKHAALSTPMVLGTLHTNGNS